jgi:hypothetical protein
MIQLVAGQLLYAAAVHSLLKSDNPVTKGVGAGCKRPLRPYPKTLEAIQPIVEKSLPFTPPF